MKLFFIFSVLQIYILSLHILSVVRHFVYLNVGKITIIFVFVQFFFVIQIFGSFFGVYILLKLFRAHSIL